MDVTTVSRIITEPRWEAIEAFLTWAQRPDMPAAAMRALTARETERTETSHLRWDAYHAVEKAARMYNLGDTQLLAVQRLRKCADRTVANRGDHDVMAWCESIIQALAVRGYISDNHFFAIADLQHGANRGSDRFDAKEWLLKERSAQ